MEHRLEGTAEGKKAESSSEAVAWQSYKQEILVAWTKVTKVKKERSGRMLRFRSQSNRCAEREGINNWQRHLGPLCQ